MKDETFEKMDEEFMNQFKTVREKKVPSRILDDFSASVEKRILEKQAGKNFRFGLPAWAPVWVPALAVLLLFVSTAVLQNPGDTRSRRNTGPAPATISVTPGSEISDELGLLRDLGEWTDDDEAEFN